MHKQKDHTRQSMHQKVNAYQPVLFHHKSCSSNSVQGHYSHHLESLGMYAGHTYEYKKVMSRKE